MFVMLAKTMYFSQLPAVKKPHHFGEHDKNKYSTYFVTALAFLLNQEDRNPFFVEQNSIFKGRRKLLVSNTWLPRLTYFMAAFLRLHPMRAAMRRHRSFSKIPVQYLILKEAHNG